MRDIKFRAWDSFNGIMHYDNTSVLQSMAFYAEHKDKPNYNKYLQYTGYKDINGREIYVGDVVSRLYRFYIGHGDVDEQSETIVIDDIRNLLFDESTIVCEVIGNIYENKELLKD